MRPRDQFVQHRLDVRPHLQIARRDPFPDSPRVAEVARPVAVIAQCGSRVEDAHALPQAESLGRAGQDLITHVYDIAARVERAAKQPVGEAVEEAQPGRHGRSLAHPAYGSDEESARPRTCLPNDQDHRQRHQAGEIALPRER
jgi:hypothetical protein